MADWVTISSLATAGGTLVLAVATFAAVHSANRAARVAEQAARTAERSMLAGLRPVLVASRLQDPRQKIQFQEEDKYLVVDGSRAALEVTSDVVYMALSIRNVGTGLAVLHGWFVCAGSQYERAHPPLAEFTDQIRDIFLAAEDIGVWSAAYRDPSSQAFQLAADAIKNGRPLTLHLLYGDYEGGQRVITQFSLRHPGETWLGTAVRHYNVDRPEPRAAPGQSDPQAESS
ncbi:MAG TPA: hypothetical protein VFV41_25085 [Streptosporangiaceae bacterium]|nr:hypothetical protein [Streptosporangiaceae bacterium]